MKTVKIKNVLFGEIVFSVGDRKEHVWPTDSAPASALLNTYNGEDIIRAIQKVTAPEPRQPYMWLGVDAEAA